MLMLLVESTVRSFLELEAFLDDDDDDSSKLYTRMATETEFDDGNTAMACPGKDSTCRIFRLCFRMADSSNAGQDFDTITVRNNALAVELSIMLTGLEQSSPI